MVTDRGINGENIKMNNVSYRENNGILTILLQGHIDSANASEVEKEILLREETRPQQVVIDCADLAYISSAGLRVILRQKKSYPELLIINVNP